MRIDSVDIIKDLVLGIPFPMRFDEVEMQGSSWKLYTYNTQYLTKGFTIEIGNLIYKIIDIDSESITVTGSEIPDISIGFYLPPLKFWHGTIIQTNTELTKLTNVFDKTPMCYLQRPFREIVNGKEFAVDREIDLTLYFLTQANFPAWSTDEHDRYAIKPMKNVVEAFIKHINGNKFVGVFDTFTSTDRIKFGVGFDRGVEKSYWTDCLSGVEIGINLPILKNYQCNC
jgi:hypothetical protein